MSKPTTHCVNCIYYVQLRNYCACAHPEQKNDRYKNMIVLPGIEGNDCSMFVGSATHPFKKADFTALGYIPKQTVISYSNGDKRDFNYFEHNKTKE